MKKEKLIEQIEKFLKTYARKNEEDEYTSPDAYQLEAAITELKETNKISQIPWSEWGSGGYHPFTSKKGFKEHQKLLEKIKKYL